MAFGMGCEILCLRFDSIRTSRRPVDWYALQPPSKYVNKSFYFGLNLRMEWMLRCLRYKSGAGLAIENFPLLATLQGLSSGLSRGTKPDNCSPVIVPPLAQPLVLCILYIVYCNTVICPLTWVCFSHVYTGRLTKALCLCPELPEFSVRLNYSKGHNFGSEFVRF